MALLTLSSAFTITTILILMFAVNRLIRDPYMDEIFHIPQTQTFCAGNWTQYHPLITTLPGTYILPALFSQIFQYSILPDLLPIITCSVSYLRLFGIIYIVLCLPIVNEIIWMLHGDSIIAKLQSIAKKRTQQFNVSPKYHKIPGQPIKLSPSDFDEMIDRIKNHFAVEILFVPIHYFFVFLFYTDIPSTFWLLSDYLIHLKLSHSVNQKVHQKYHVLILQVIGLMVGFIAILHRQTNVIWIGFFFLNSVYDSFVSPLDRDRTRYRLHSLNLIVLIRWCWKHKFTLILTLWFDLVLFVGFIAFVVLNGSIVVGDASHHSISLHFAQILYLIGLLAVFTMIPTVCYKLIQHRVHWKDCCIFWMRSKMVPLMVLFMLFLIFRLRFTEVHDFLLSDNRHYSFYLWRYFMSKTWFTLIIVPTAAVAVLLMYDELRTIGAVSKYWCLVYSLCCGLVLIPTPLFEFRYFIIPILVFKLHYLCSEAVMIQMVERVVFDRLEKNWKQKLGIVTLPLVEFVMDTLPSGSLMGFERINLIFYALINALTLYVFVARPYQWVDGSTARFMW